jgi:hypothetical protein
MSKTNKKITFNCTFDQVFEALEKVGVFFRLNGYNVEVSKTTSNAIFTCEEPEVKVEIEIHKQSHETLLMSISSFVELSHESHFEEWNIKVAEKVIDRIFTATRNLIENKSSIELDLKEATIESLKNDKKVANKILNRLLLLIFVPILVGALLYLAYSIYFK